MCRSGSRKTPDPTIQLQAQIFPALAYRTVKYNPPTQFVVPQQAYSDIRSRIFGIPSSGNYRSSCPSPALRTPRHGRAPAPSVQLAGVYDYFSLVQAVLDFSHRGDIANYMDYYVRQAETRIYRDIFAQNLGNGVKWLEQPFSATIAAGVAAIPTGYLALKTMQVANGFGNVETLLYKDPQWIYANYESGSRRACRPMSGAMARTLSLGPIPIRLTPSRALTTGRARP